MAFKSKSLAPLYRVDFCGVLTVKRFISIESSKG